MTREQLAEHWDRFWHEQEILRVRLTTFRVVFFALLGLDMWVLMVPHAPRHDLGAFNVKGVTAPVEVRRLSGIGAARTRFDISRARGLSRFVGRSMCRRSVW